MASSHPRSSHVLGSLLVIFFSLVLASAQPAAAQTGADVAASITGNLRVRIGENITYTITATNVGDQAATGVQASGWVPDWFGFVSLNCPGGTLDGSGTCNYPDLAPGDSVSMTITLQAIAGNKQERRMYELGFVNASNDMNPANNEARIEVHMTGPCRDCPNK